MKSKTLPTSVATQIADPGASPYVDVLNTGFKWGNPGSSSDTTYISFYLAGNEVVDYFGDSIGHSKVASSDEKAAVKLALQQFEDVCNVEFVKAPNLEAATIFLAHIPDAESDGALGFAYFPGDAVNANTGNDQTGVAINYEAYRSTDGASLKQGGYDFVTYIHELGHAMGLAHPHDLDTGLFPGIVDNGDNEPFTFDQTGDNDLNQGVYTMMSYIDGWITTPAGALDRNVTPDYGWEGTPMALDIATLQYQYGANTHFHTGRDTYTLASADGPGTFYTCIWDAGGTDTIAAGKSLNVTIDLHDATLLNEPGGGGFISWAEGVHGGYTIANGAVIENAFGGAGADRLIGNDVDNEIRGGDGADLERGFGGSDRMFGGKGADTIDGGAGRDFLSGGRGDDLFVFSYTSDSTYGNIDTILDFSRNDQIDLSAIDAITATSADDAFSFIARAKFDGAAGELRFLSKDDYCFVLGDVNGDSRADLVIRLADISSLNVGDFVL